MNGDNSVTYRKEVLMSRLIPLMALVLGLLLQAPAFAATTPPLAEALSSARVGLGNVVTDGAGRPVPDAQGQPVRVTGIDTAPFNQSVASLATAMRVPVADLLAYAQRLGMTLPIMMSGTRTQVTRSDGGVEEVFVFSADGAEYAFMADKTGANCFGVRMANVDASGMGRVMTAHGLNGNFTNPPWYLSAEARQDYWIAWGQEQVLTPPAVRAARVDRGVGSLGAAPVRSGIRVGDHRRLNQGQGAILADTGARSR